MMMRQVLFSGILILAAACGKEGCTDKTALNYDITAKKDDGGCQYCEEITSDLGTFSLVVADGQSTSQYYNDTVVEVEIMRETKSFNYGNCGGESICNTKVKITNLTGENITDLRFHLNFTLTSGEVLKYYPIQYVKVPANGELLIEDATDDFVSFVACSSLDGASLNYAYLFSANYN